MAGPKILGQITGTGLGTNVPVYTAPTATGSGGATVSSLVLINSASGSLKVQVSVVPAGATAATVHILVPTTSISVSDIRVLTIGITLAPGDRIFAAAESGINVHAYGMEL